MSSSGGGNRGEQILRKRLIDVLDTLSEHIPERAGHAATLKQGGGNNNKLDSAGLTLDETPIIRSGRTFPSVGASHLQAYQLPSFQASGAGSSRVAEASLYTPVYLEGQTFLVRGISGGGGGATGGIPVNGVQRNLRGPLVGVGSMPPFYSQSNATPASTKSTRARPYASQHQQRASSVNNESLDGPSAALLAAGDGAASSQQHQQQHFRRSGSEEVALHTPIHTASANGDYEWKRVENSRSWNNLRGMWGKRSVPLDAGGDLLKVSQSDDVQDDSSAAQGKQAGVSSAAPASPSSPATEV